MKVLSWLTTPFATLRKHVPSHADAEGSEWGHRFASRCEQTIVAFVLAVMFCEWLSYKSIMFVVIFMLLLVFGGPAFRKFSSRTGHATLTDHMSSTASSTAEFSAAWWTPQWAVSSYAWSLRAAVALHDFAAKHHFGTFAFKVMMLLYFFLSQPSFTLLLSLGCGFYCAWRFARWHSKPSGAGQIFVVCAGVVASFVGVVLATLFVFFEVMYFGLSSLLSNLTVWLYQVSPLLFVLFTIAVTGYCTYRQPRDHKSWYWASTPAFALAFLWFYWPTHSLLAKALCLLTAIDLSTLAYLQRPRSEEDVVVQHIMRFAAQNRLSSFTGFRSLYANYTFGIAFCLWFLLAPVFPGLYDYQMANALDVEYIDQQPTTIPNRLVPYVAASDYCKAGNHDASSEIRGDAEALVIGKIFYWGCLLYPKWSQDHLVHYWTGGTDGFVLANAGTRDRQAHTVNVGFLFAPNSKIAKGALYWRHPGSVMTGVTIARRKNAGPYVEGQESSSDYTALITYTSWEPQWFAGMVPQYTGVVAISSWGTMEDYTPKEAEREFPGVTLYPNDLALRYATLWAQDSSFFAKHWRKGSLLEVSDFHGEGNPFPRWQDTSQGLSGVIPFEPLGTSATALAAVGYFDRSRGLMHVYYIPPGVDQPGPKQIAANPYQCHQGAYNVETSETGIIVAPSGRIYYLVALTQKDKINGQFHGYTGNILYDGGGGWCKDVESADELSRVLAEREAQLNSPASGK